MTLKSSGIKKIEDLQERVEMLEQVDDVLFEELKVLSILIQEGSESDGKLEELNRQLEELKNKKNKPTIIVKEVEVDKKKRR